MTRAQFYTCVGLSCLAGLAAAPAFAQAVGQVVSPYPETSKPYLRGRVLTWPGKTETGQAPPSAPPPLVAAPVSTPVPLAPAPAPARPAYTPRALQPQVRPAPVSIYAAPPPAPAVDSRYGPPPAAAVPSPPPVHVARSVPVKPAQAAPNPWAAASRVPLTPAEAQPGQWIVIRGPKPAFTDTHAAFTPPALAKPAPVAARALDKAPPPPRPALTRTPPVLAAAPPTPAKPEPAKAARREGLPVQAAAARPAPTPAAQPAVKTAAASSPAAQPGVPDIAKLPRPVHPWTERFAAWQPEAAAPAEPGKPEKAAAAKPVRKAVKQAAAKTTLDPAPVGPPRPLPPGERVRFYSVHRDFGLTPDPAPIPPQFFGATADLSEPAGPEATPAQTTGKGTAAARSRALADTSSSNE